MISSILSSSSFFVRLKTRNYYLNPKISFHRFSKNSRTLSVVLIWITKVIMSQPPMSPTLHIHCWNDGSKTWTILSLTLFYSRKRHSWLLYGLCVISYFFLIGIYALRLWALFYFLSLGAIYHNTWETHGKPTIIPLSPNPTSPFLHIHHTSFATPPYSSFYYFFANCINTK